MNFIAVYGRLTNDPRQIPTKNTDTTMVVGSVAVDVDSRGSEPTTEFFGLVCFGRQAKYLLRHVKGDSLSVSGRLQLNVYENKQGKSIRQLQILADSLIGARSNHPGRPSRNPKPSLNPIGYPEEFIR